MSVLVSTLSKSQGDLSGPNLDDHFSNAAKMQLYFVNCLVGFFVVVATFPTASARVPPFFETLAEQAETADSGALGKPLLNEPANELTPDEPLTAKKTNQKKKRRLVKKYVEVELTEPIEGVVIKEGQSYMLSCTVHAHPEATIHWLRGENIQSQIEELLEKSVGDASMVDPNRIAQSHSRYVVDCASKSDEGPIHCVGISGPRVNYQSTDIIVERNEKSIRAPCSPLRKPVITSNVDAIFAVIGSTLVIPCEAKGSPTPVTRWIDNKNRPVTVNMRQDGRFTVLESGELVIEDLLWEDMGNHKCIATNRKGETDTIETFVYPMLPST